MGTSTEDVSLRRRHSEMTRELVLRTVAAILEEGGDLSVPEVARRSGVSLRTVYRYFPTREALIAAAGEWIGSTMFGAEIPSDLDEIPAVFARNAALWDDHPRLVETMALSRGANSLRSVRRQARLAKLREALEEATKGLSEQEAKQAFAVFAYLDNMLAWLTMRDEAGLDGVEVGAAVGWAMQALTDDLRRRQRAAGRSEKETV